MNTNNIIKFAREQNIIRNKSFKFSAYRDTVRELEKNKWEKAVLRYGSMQRTWKVKEKLLDLPKIYPNTQHC